MLFRWVFFFVFIVLFFFVFANGFGLFCTPILIPTSFACMLYHFSWKIAGLFLILVLHPLTILPGNPRGCYWRDWVSRRPRKFSYLLRSRF